MNPLLRLSRAVLFALPALLAASSCRQTSGGADTDADATTGVPADSTVYAESLFGGIPSVYEYEMLKATDAASAQLGGDHEAVRTRLMDQADSIFRVAETQAYARAADMHGQLVHYAIDAGVGYDLTSEVSIVSTTLPTLSAMGDGAQEVDVKFCLRGDGSTDKGFYVLSGTDGDVGVGRFDLYVTNDSTPLHVAIKAPNVPAAILDNVTMIHFITADRYDSLYVSLSHAQEVWRDAYRRANGLD